MRRIALVGVNAIGEKQKLSANVEKFTNDTDYFGITVHNNTLKMATPNGVYYLRKHPTENYFAGVCKGKKVQVSLKKIIGEVRFW